MLALLLSCGRGGRLWVGRVWMQSGTGMCVLLSKSTSGNWGEKGTRVSIGTRDGPSCKSSSCCCPVLFFLAYGSALDQNKANARQPRHSFHTISTWLHLSTECTSSETNSMRLCTAMETQTQACLSCANPSPDCLCPSSSFCDLHTLATEFHILGNTTDATLGRRVGCNAITSSSFSLPPNNCHARCRSKARLSVTPGSFARLISLLRGRAQVALAAYKGCLNTALFHTEQNCADPAASLFNTTAIGDRKFIMAGVAALAALQETL